MATHNAGAAPCETGLADQRRAAYESIIRETQSTLMRVALRMCRHDEDRAQDAVQDALVKGYVAFLDGRFTAGTNARAWLLRILTNGYINDYHRRTRWDAGVDAETVIEAGGAPATELHAQPSATPVAALLNAALDEPLEQALAALPDEQRACVILVDIEELEYAEAATILGVPIGTVRSRLSRARLRLHALLYDYARDRRWV